MSKVELQERIKTAAITSFCVANSFVISAVLKHYAHKDDEIVLFEATSNQVNHLGGYTGMKPADYKQMVLDLAGKDDFSQDRIVFGGDHLGPLPFKHLDKDKAMKEAEKLVRSYVLAGFEKLHIDTSMSLGTERCLSNEEIAKRGVRLIAVAEDAFKQYSQSNANAIHPVYIIGSEVPPAGGKTNNEDSLKVTSFKEVKDVLSTYQAEFEKCGLNGIWKYVIGIVIQPGVEFGHTSVDHFIGNALDYDINKCQELGICFEAHSTDYQSKAELRQLVENNFLILKVGPALTKSLTEALLKLDRLRCLIGENCECEGDFSRALKQKMLANPCYWQKYYSSSDDITILFSLLDRSRYYLSDSEVNQMIHDLLDSFGVRISDSVPAGLLRYYFPEQFRRLAWERVSATDILNDFVSCQIEDYDLACCNIRSV